MSIVTKKKASKRKGGEAFMMKSTGGKGFGKRSSAGKMGGKGFGKKPAKRAITPY